MNEIKIGSIVDVFDNSGGMYFMKGKLKHGVLTEERLTNRNPWEVMAIGQGFPTESFNEGHAGKNDAMIKNVKDDTIIAFTKKIYVRPHVDPKQERIMENKRSSLKKWRDGASNISSLINTLTKMCGYCENVGGSRNCDKCILNERGLCCHPELNTNTTFGRAICALKTAYNEADQLRGGIEEDIEGSVVRGE